MEKIRTELTIVDSESEPKYLDPVVVLRGLKLLRPKLMELLPLDNYDKHILPQIFDTLEGQKLRYLALEGFFDYNNLSALRVFAAELDRLICSVEAANIEDDKWLNQNPENKYYYGDR